MGRTVQTLPRPGCLVELTRRTIQGRFLFRPSPELNALIVGVLAKAQEQTGMKIHAVHFASNHYHLLISPRTIEQMADFTRHLGTNLSKEVGRLHDWPGSLFEGRSRPIPVSDEEQAQAQRLIYILGQATKDNLVASPADWPGVHVINALVRDEPLRGTWIDRTALHARRQRGEDVAPADVSSEMTLELSPLPCWSSVTPAEYRRRVQTLVAEIEHQGAATRVRERITPLGVRTVLKQRPHHRPEALERRPAPRFHAFSETARRQLETGYRAFLIAYREAADRLKRGQPDVVFPESCFPPRPPARPPQPPLEPG